MGANLILIEKKINNFFKPKNKTLIITLFNKIQYNFIPIEKAQQIFSLAIFLCIVLFCSCNKEDECLDATVRFTNTSDYPYNLYVDVAFQKEITGNTFFEIDLLEGEHSARAEQVSGFLLFPTIKKTTLNVFGCQEVGWVFP